MKEFQLESKSATWQSWRFDIFLKLRFQHQRSSSSSFILPSVIFIRVMLLEPGDSFICHLQTDVIRELSKAIDEFGVDRFCSYLPPSWFRNRSPSSIHSGRELFDLLMSTPATVKQLDEILCLCEMDSYRHLIVSYAPLHLTEKLPPMMTVKEGDDLKVKCEARGFPSPRYRWFCCRRDDGDNLRPMTDQTTNVLHILSVRKDDAGKYACEIFHTNKKGKTKYVRTKIMDVVVSSSTWPSAAAADPTAKCKDQRPVIVNQPVAPSDYINAGASVVLEIEVNSETPVTFTWLRNGDVFKETPDGKLKLTNVQREGNVDSWRYNCEVANKFGKRLSEEVKIQLSPDNKNCRYTAKDKVALVIGNGNYDLHGKLNSAIEDAATVSCDLTLLGFKVISLVNLSLVAMKNAVHTFCSFIDEGVYAFFYYAGHGFERDKQNYMLPVNCPEKYSLSSSLHLDWVRSEIQKRKPTFLGIIYDTCRSYPEKDSPAMKEKPDYSVIIPYPNFIIAYATIFGCQAFELSDQKNGIYVSHLTQFIKSKESFRDLVDRVRRCIKKHPEISKLQHPTIDDSLIYNYSLADVIKIGPEDEIWQRQREEKWKEINSISFSCRFENDSRSDFSCAGGLTVPLTQFPDAQIEINAIPKMNCLLNSLEIHAVVHSTGKKYRIGINRRDSSIKNECWKESEILVTFDGLHLEEDHNFPFTLFVVVSDAASEKYERREILLLNFGRPLIVAAELWKERDETRPGEEGTWDD